MPGLLSGVSLSDEAREKNSRTHRPVVVLAVLGMLGLYLYLFSSLSMRTPLPTPQELATLVGFAPETVLDVDGNVRGRLWATFSYSPPVLTMPLGNRMAGNDDLLLILFLVIAAAFLTVYFVPLRFKRPSLVGWTLVGLVILYGPRPTGGLLFAHLVVYLTLHPRRERPTLWSAATGALGYLALGPPGPWSAGDLLGTVVAAGAGALLYRHVVLRLLDRPRAARVLRTAVVQSAMLTIVVGVVLSGLTRQVLGLLLGVLLFFWQWERLMMYHADYKDDLVPRDLPLLDYLAVFLSPGNMLTWNWGVEIGQGYAYTTNNFLPEDKNKLALKGLKIWGVSLSYLVLYDSAVVFADRVLGGWGIEIYGIDIQDMVCHYISGGEVSTPSVLLTTILDRLRWLMLWGGIVHFKVGVWRVCGFHMDAYFDKPWMATNLVNFWARYTFHYREFLVRCFYYPVFFRFFKRHTKTRVLVATLAAAAFGNLIWGHLSEFMYYQGLDVRGVYLELNTWPYFVLLGLGIGIAQLYLLRKTRRTKVHRRPWTLDRRLPLDVLSAYVTLQFFSLITIFRRPCGGSTLLDRLRLILVGLGIDL